MTTKTPKTAERPVDGSRRSFLRMAATAGPAVAVTTVAGTEAGAETAAAAEPQGNGLRKTAHTQAYLASARF